MSTDMEKVEGRMELNVLGEGNERDLCSSWGT